jgi:NADH dehydrogenase (ubiquinone) Fe-S protein 1
MKPVQFKINDFQYTINNKLTLIQACLKNKIDVPRFCFHEKLSIAGNCRMCLVEDLKQVKPLASCAINVSNSMNIYTNTVKVKKARESVLEFLLANHPLDCPVCDQGGECDLQDQSLVFGSDRGRFYEFKRAVEDKDCGPLIKTIMNRCIHCTRCVRFSNELAGVNVLGVTGRGSKMEIGFYIENLMTSELSGNVIDLCPVGALTSKPFAFTARPWELKSYNTIDVLDGFHSNIRVDVRGTKIMRVLPRVNQNLNEDWISDKIRFSYDSFRRQRLFDPLLKIQSTNFVRLGWKSAFIAIKSVLLNSLRSNTLSFLPLRGFIGHHVDVETIYTFKRLTLLLGSPFLDSSTFSDFTSNYSLNTEISSLSSADICVIFDTNIRIQLPLLNVKLRQSSVKFGLPIYTLGFYSNFNFYVKHLGFSLSLRASILEGTHWLSTKISKRFSSRPLLFFSNVSDSEITILSSFTNVITPVWFGFNLIMPDTSSYLLQNFIYYGKNNKNLLLTKNSINYFVNDNRGFSNKSAFAVYQGHHGDGDLNYMDMVLPSTAFIEKNTLYCNLYGLVQKTKKVIFNVGNSRDDWKIFTALGHFFGFTSSFPQSSVDLVNYISKTSPNVLFNFGKPHLIISYFQKIIHFSQFKSRLNNFYLSDSITRNSKIMSLCSTRFKSLSYNFF